MPPLALVGQVTKVGVMAKTATITVTRYVDHPLTHKRVVRHKKYLTHDPENQLKLDDRVVIRNCPPVSARKRFKLESILESPETQRLNARNASPAPAADAQLS